jgi:hypothetical protein
MHCPQLWPVTDSSGVGAKMMASSILLLLMLLLLGAAGAVCMRAARQRAEGSSH